MFRVAEVAVFSVFFVFSFIKTFSADFLNINTLTYVYYFLITTFLIYYFLIYRPTKVHYLFAAIFISLAWLVIVGLILADSRVFVLGKLQGLVLSLISIPIAIYMYQRDLLKVAVLFTSIFLILISALFSVFVTYDDTNPAYILNEVYLHGSFLAGFMIFLAILLKLPIIWSILLLGCLIILGGRGPFLSFFIVSLFMIINHGVKLLYKPTLNKSGALISLFSFPVITLGIIYFIPNIFDRMLARWMVIFSTAGGGDSARSRLEHLTTSLTAIDTSPFIGIGIANYGQFKFGYHNVSYPHNFVLEILAENGWWAGFHFLFVTYLFKSFGNKTLAITALCFCLFTYELFICKLK